MTRQLHRNGECPKISMQSYSARLPLISRTGLDSRWVAPGLSRVGITQDDATGQRVSSMISRFLPHLHSDTSIYSLLFALIGSQKPRCLKMLNSLHTLGTCNVRFIIRGTEVAEQLACSPPTKANRVQSPSGSLPDFHKWESRRTMSLVGGLRDLPFSSPLHSGAAPYSPHSIIVGSQDLGLTAAQISTLTRSKHTSKWLHCPATCRHVVLQQSAARSSQSNTTTFRRAFHTHASKCYEARLNSAVYIGSLSCLFIGCFPVGMPVLLTLQYGILPVYLQVAITQSQCWVRAQKTACLPEWRSVHVLCGRRCVSLASECPLAAALVLFEATRPVLYSVHYWPVINQWRAEMILTQSNVLFRLKDLQSIVSLRVAINSTFSSFIVTALRCSCEIMLNTNRTKTARQCEPMRTGAAVAERLACSPPTKTNQVHSPAGSLLDFRMWESCRTIPLVCLAGGVCARGRRQVQLAPRSISARGAESVHLLSRLRGRVGEHSGCQFLGTEYINLQRRNPVVKPCVRAPGRGGRAVSTLASQQGDPGSIPGGAIPGLSRVVIVPDDAAGWRLFSGISCFSRPFIPALLHTHLTSPRSALKTSLLKAAQISSLNAVKLRRSLIQLREEYKCKPMQSLSALTNLPYCMWVSDARCSMRKVMAEYLAHRRLGAFTNRSRIQLDYLMETARESLLGAGVAMNHPFGCPQSPILAARGQWLLGATHQRTSLILNKFPANHSHIFCDPSNLLSQLDGIAEETGGGAPSALKRRLVELSRRNVRTS
ncbi:hypothetical protein PR048_019160 [Dryococelus australis]|uniref:Uncharacterized protein n=1 Tax=Dryococelus australis TaxID=614101 RepID=A0ABQ9H2P7_9NEOP|nr:hypothetical protein PR048_019160 [Dryococelus australis]